MKIKKLIIFIVSLFLLMAFAGLVYYGYLRSRGVTVSIKEKETVVLEAPFMNHSIDLSKGIDLSFWQSLPSKKINLIYQLMVLPWPSEKNISSIEVKAFHNKRDIYFYITWKDNTEDRKIGIGKFSDQTAIMFPLREEVQPSTLMMGFVGGANIWQWKASQDRAYWAKAQKSEVRGQKSEDRSQRSEVRGTEKAYSDFYYPFEEEELFPVSKEKFESAVNDLSAIRVGTITQQENQNVDGRGMWRDSEWHVVLKRSLKSEDKKIDADFVSQKQKLTAFAVWNGSNGDRGGRKSISDWVELEIR